MRRTIWRLAGAIGVALACVALLLPAPRAAAQDVDQVAQVLERQGYYIEAGAEGDDGAFQDLVDRGRQSADEWYFVSMASDIDVDFEVDLRDRLGGNGNVLVYYPTSDGFVEVALATGYGISTENQALAPFDEDWDTPAEFMSDVVDDLDDITSSSGGNSGSSSSGSSGNSGAPESSDSGGSGFNWLWIAIPAILLGGFWFMRRSGKRKQQDSDLETAQKIRDEIQSELDELANDVIVLSGPVDLSDKPDAVTNYREATATYMDISDEIPDPDKLAEADLKELSELGARVSHARWQMDAAEAIMDGEPIPEKPKVAPPPTPPRPAPREPIPQSRLPQRQPRPRVPYSRSRRRSGGGLLDILIAGAGMMGSRGGGRRGRSSFPGGTGGMFGGSRSSSRSAPRSSRSAPRSGGGVFGSGSRSSRSSSRSGRSSSSNRSRSSNRSSSSSRRRTRSGGSTRRRKRR